MSCQAKLIYQVQHPIFSSYFSIFNKSWCSMFFIILQKVVKHFTDAWIFSLLRDRVQNSMLKKRGNH